jgi:hypothetical protein
VYIFGLPRFRLDIFFASRAFGLDFFSRCASVWIFVISGNQHQ